MLREIPHEYWPEFLSSFASEHRGLAVTLERHSPAGVMVEAQDWPLRQVVSEADEGHRQISILIGKEEGAALTHVVEEPTSVRVIDEERVELEAADGTVSVIYLAAKERRQPRAAAAT